MILGPWEPRRFTGHTTQELTSLYAIQDYQNEFRFHLPHEQRPAGRPAKTTPLTPVLEQAGAHFFVVSGWERSDYFKSTADFTETYSYAYNEVHEVVAAEVSMVQNGVGLAEVNGFNRIEITGEGARDWLDYMICSRLPRKLGKVGFGYLLNNDGNVKVEATIANLPDGRIWYGWPQPLNFTTWIGSPSICQRMAPCNCAASPMITRSWCSPAPNLAMF